MNDMITELLITFAFSIVFVGLILLIDKAYENYRHDKRKN
jgi:hypothetical protein